MISKTCRLLHRRALLLLSLQPKPLWRRRELRMPAALLMPGGLAGRPEAKIGGGALTGVAGVRTIGRRSRRMGPPTRVAAGLRMLGLAMIRVHRAGLARMRSGGSMLTFNALPVTRGLILGCHRMVRRLATPDHTGSCP